MGALFRSRDFQNNESELVVTVTAYLVNPVAPDRDRPARRRLRGSDRSGNDPARPAQCGLRQGREGHAGNAQKRHRLHRAVRETMMTHSNDFLRGCAALAALALGACAYPINGPEDAMTVEQRFPITVEPHMEMVRLPFNAARGGLDQARQRRSRTLCARLSGQWQRRPRNRRLSPQSGRAAHHCRPAGGAGRPKGPHPHRKSGQRRYRGRRKAQLYPLPGSCRGLWRLVGQSRFHLGEQGIAEFRLRDPAQSRRHGGRSARSGVAQAA